MIEETDLWLSEDRRSFLRASAYHIGLEHWPAWLGSADRRPYVTNMFVATSN
jgi:hypothetical protein